MKLSFKTDPFPSRAQFDALWNVAWGHDGRHGYPRILERSLGHIGAFDDAQRLIGFINVAWDGGIHAFLLDTCVDPAFRRQGVATGLITRATTLAGARGADWLHVDFEPHLVPLYRACGFAPTNAGLIALKP